MQGNGTNIIVVTIVTDKVKEFIGKLGLWVRELEGKSLGTFLSLEEFWGRKQCENKWHWN
jgi:hypothetical protein